MADIPYTTKPSSLKDLFAQIQVVGKPPKVTFQWLQSIGFKSSNDRYITGILKALGFIDGTTPTEMWGKYRNKATARSVMAQGLRQAYPTLFTTYPDAYKQQDSALHNFFSSHTDVSAPTIGYMVRTFKALADLADFDATAADSVGANDVENTSTTTHKTTESKTSTFATAPAALLPITMNIQIVIPSDASPEQYDNIFASIKKFLTPQD